MSFNNDDFNNDYEYSYDRSKLSPLVPEPQPEPPRKPRKKGRFTAKIVALCVCCALLGGVACGAAVYGIGAAKQKDAPPAGTSATDPGAAETLSSAESGGVITTVENNKIQTYTSTNETALSNTEIYYNFAPAVVGITTETTTGYNVFGQSSTSTVSGTGFFISKDGYILTCAHVVEGADAVTVTNIDNKTYEAEVIGYDSTSDVGLLKVTSDEEFNCVSIGSIDDILVGQAVSVIGNPLGELTYTLTTGCVSALDREVNISGTAMNVFQIDAAVNSGNSGGPVFDMYGRVIGIVNAKSSGTGVEGLGFAIPIDDAMKIVSDLQEYGYVSRPYFGITPRDLDTTTASYYNLPAGVYVDSVSAGSCAEKAGITAGDIITAVGDEAVTSKYELNAVKNRYSPGDTVTVTVYRSGQSLTLTVTLDETPQTDETEAATVPETTNPYGGSYGGSYEDFFGRFFGN